MNFMPVRQNGTVAAQRAVGRLALGFKRGLDGQTRVEQFYQEGCLKARLPRPAVPEICEAVLMNISGGVAGGDALDTAITLGDGAQLAVSTQAAERLYRALHGVPARVSARITLGTGARLNYLPQETIFFDGFALERSLEIDLAAGAEFLGVESFVFGRVAMRETVQNGWLRDEIRLRRDGVLHLVDMSRLEGDVAASLGRKAVADGARAMASLIYAAPDAAIRLAPVRAALEGAMAGATLVEGVLRARILAPDAASLRHYVVAALRMCRAGRALPRVWQG